jgi:flagellar motility protein MotE (MotC chaperone)
MLRYLVLILSFFCFSFINFSVSLESGTKWEIGPQVVHAQLKDNAKDKVASKKASRASLNQRPQSVNVETLRLIERIEIKTKELKKREEAVKLKEQQLKGLEKKVKKDLKKIEDAIDIGQELLGISDDLNQENLDLLVKIYSSMRPEAAAPLIGALDERIGIPIISRMKSKIAAQVLSQMDPKAVKLISEKLVNPSKYKDPNNR